VGKVMPKHTWPPFFVCACKNCVAWCSVEGICFVVLLYLHRQQAQPHSKDPQLHTLWRNAQVSAQ
jgi:hypothetical protein